MLHAPYHILSAALRSYSLLCSESPRRSRFEEREENEEMRLGVGKWPHEFQFPSSSGRSEKFGTDPTPIKANDKMSIDSNENMVDLLWLYCSLFSNFILRLAGKFGFSFKC